MQQYGISSTVVISLAKNYGESYIQEKIKFMKETSAYKNGKIRDVAGYLIDAIKNDYKVPIISHIIVNEEIKFKDARLEEKNELMTKYQTYVTQTTMESFYALAEEKRELIEKAFVKVLSENILKTPILASYKASRFSSEFNCQEFVKFITVNYPYLQQENISWDEFYKRFKSQKKLELEGS